MHIVFLDASTVDRGDIDFSGIESEGHLTCHPTTTADEAPGRCIEASIILSNKVLITPAVLDAAPDLKLVVAAATGVNHIDLDACKARGIAVANVAGYSTDSVAQHCFAMLLELATRVSAYSSRIREDWPASPIFTRLDHPLFELSGKTLGIVGLGAIGAAVARIGQAFGMRVIALGRHRASDDGPVPRLAEADFLAACDVVSLHCPLTDQTRHFIDAGRLAAMKPGAILINTGRGPLIVEAAVADSLRGGHLGGAGLDVLSSEPPAPDNPLLAADIPNLLITPHTAWSTVEARRRLLDGIAGNIRAFKRGEKLNRII